jgi:glycine cleavage system regulatory protein
VATFILTVTGHDRPGVVSALAAAINAHDASWEDSQLSQLAGRFAGSVVVAVADERLEALVADLTALSEPGLQIDVERTDEPVERESLRLHLELLGADRPGIVAQISASLASLGVNIDELTTDVRDAPMAGGTLFEARAVLSAPTATSTDELRSLLEGLGDEMMVEIRVSEG